MSTSPQGGSTWHFFLGKKGKDKINETKLVGCISLALFLLCFHFACGIDVYTKVIVCRSFAAQNCPNCPSQPKSFRGPSHGRLPFLKECLSTLWFAQAPTGPSTVADARRAPSQAPNWSVIHAQRRKGGPGDSHHQDRCNEAPVRDGNHPERGTST